MFKTAMWPHCRAMTIASVILIVAISGWACSNDESDAGETSQEDGVICADGDPNCTPVEGEQQRAKCDDAEGECDPDNGGDNPEGDGPVGKGCAKKCPTGEACRFHRGGQVCVPTSCIDPNDCPMGHNCVEGACEDAVCDGLDWYDDQCDEFPVGENTTQCFRILQAQACLKAACDATCDEECTLVETGRIWKRLPEPSDPIEEGECTNRESFYTCGEGCGTGHDVEPDQEGVEAGEGGLI